MAIIHEWKCDVLVAGGGTGGCAAALAAADSGKNVILTEASDWIGGQLTAQAVPPDEHGWIESFGCTRRYRQFRNAVRNYYREHYPLTANARNTINLNPGGGTVSRLCHEPRVAVAVLEQMLSYHIACGNIRILKWHEPVSADVDGDTVRSVTFSNVLNLNQLAVVADFVLDATETGELLKLAAVEYVSGAESQDETGEPHAPAGPAQPDNVQALTWCFAIGHDPGSHRLIDRPHNYGYWRDYVPDLKPGWPGPLLNWTYTHPITMQPYTRPLFPETADAPSFWLYRRLICREHYAPPLQPHEVTLVNWPQNDYMKANIIDQPGATVAASLAEARDLSLSLFYWLQTEAPRPDGGTGYPGLYLRPDITDTADGLAKTPYIRESRRIKAAFTVYEEHIASDTHKDGKPALFSDSVGIGYYRLDLHPSSGGDNYIDIGALPFQIPLGALIPIRVRNLLPACKNIGTTHITNGCYRLHPVEWNIGEAAGFLAAFSSTQNTIPAAIHENEAKLAAFQQLLRRQGVELEWPAT